MPEYAFAVAQYIDGMQSLRTSLASITPSKMVLSLASILCMIYELLHGRRKELAIHLRHSANLAETWQTDSDSDSDSIDDNEEVRSIILHLNIEHVIYSQSRLDERGELLLMQAFQFDNAIESEGIHHARQSLIRIMNHSLRYFSVLDPGNNLDGFDAAHGQANLIARLRHWFEVFGNKRRHLSGNNTAACAGWHVVFVLYEACFILLRVYATRQETAFDQYTDRFQRIVSLVDFVLGKSHRPKIESQIFSLDLGLISALFLTAVKCRESSVRHQAVELLKRVPRREVLWDADAVAKASAQVIEFEEKGCRDPHSGQNFIPEEQRVISTKIDDVESENGFERFVTITWKPSPNPRSVEAKQFRI